MTLAAARRTRSARRLFGAVGLVIALVVVAACDIAVTVDANVEPDGGGTVTVTTAFSAEAAAIIADEGALRLLDTSDLAAAGWVVALPATTSDGGVEYAATKRVTGADQWQGVLDEIAGPGVFTNVAVTGTDEPDERQRALSFEIDLRQGPAVVFDQATTDFLDGEPLGKPLRQLTNGRPIDEAVTITVRASVESGGGESGAGEWQPRFNQNAPVPVRLVSTTSSTASVVFRWIAGALASLAALAAILAVTRTVLERRAAKLSGPALAEADQFAESSHSDAAADTGPARSFADAIQPEQSGSHGQPAVRMVIVDPLTVLFQQSKPIATYLLPYVRHNRGQATDEQILASHTHAINGRMDTAAMWRACGVDGDATTIDEVYCEMRWLRPGAREFLTEFSDRRIPVAALTNDTTAWSNFVRQREHLTAVWPWLVSSDEGMVKPDPALFAKLGAMIEVPWEQCLYIDTDPGALAVAQALGMRTTFFDPQGLGPDAALGHPRVGSFNAFFRRQL